MIRNITELKRTAKAQGVKVHGKPLAKTFQADTPTSGIFLTDTGSSISPELWTWRLSPVRSEAAHPMNKAARGLVTKRHELRFDHIPIPNGDTVTYLLNR